MARLTQPLTRSVTMPVALPISSGIYGRSASPSITDLSLEWDGEDGLPLSLEWDDEDGTPLALEWDR